jgi:hypothetical protein
MFVVNRSLLGLIAGSLGVAACATTPVLKPAPGDTLAPGLPNVAEATVSGVRVLVAGDAWKGDPSNLGELFTPVQVTIQNSSGKDLRVSYADFQLSGSSGFKYAAIPPMSAKGQISQTVSVARPNFQLAFYQPLSSKPHLLDEAQLGTNTDLRDRVQLVAWEHRYDHDHFLVAPHFAGYYPGWGVWPYSYPYDPFFYDSLYAYWPEQLPTQDMLSQALPEGAVQNGGKVSGFVYFQGVGKRESSVNFTMSLVDATNGQSFGQVSIPFAVSK